MNHLSDSQIRANALRMWANYIESGDVNVCAESLQKVNASPNVLSQSQKEFLVRLRKLSIQELNH